jgi:hypothetical protein
VLPEPEGAAPEPPGAVEAGGVVDEDGEGVAAPWQAPNTIIVLANKPINGFRIKTPPIQCVSPHWWSQAGAFEAAEPSIVTRSGRRLSGPVE